MHEGIANEDLVYKGTTVKMKVERIRNNIATLEYVSLRLFRRRQRLL